MSNVNDLIQIIGRFDSVRILVIGDLMLDRFIVGNVSRISPEAPVPVVDIVSETFKPGGAANAMNNIKALGGDVIAVGVIGDDESGRKLTNLLKDNGIITEGIISIQNRPTTVKTRIIAGQQQQIRIDREDKCDLNSEVTQQILDFIKIRVNKIDAIVISDYDKGVITNMLLKGVLILAKKYNKPIIVDPKLEHFLDYKGVTIVKPNLNEASIASGIKPINETSIRNIGKWILTHLECDAVLITRGKDGMSLFKKDGSVIHIPTIAKEVFDVTGAGDTVTSVVALCLAIGTKLEDAATIANTAAGIVVGKLGTATVTKAELNKILNQGGQSECLS